MAAILQMVVRQSIRRAAGLHQILRNSASPPAPAGCFPFAQTNVNPPALSEAYCNGVLCILHLFVAHLFGGSPCLPDLDPVIGWTGRSGQGFGVPRFNGRRFEVTRRFVIASVSTIACRADDDCQPDKPREDEGRVGFAPVFLLFHLFAYGIGLVTKKGGSLGAAAR